MYRWCLQMFFEGSGNYYFHEQCQKFSMIMHFEFVNKLIKC